MINMKPETMLVVSLFIIVVLPTLYVPRSAAKYPGQEQIDLIEGLSKLRDWNLIKEDQIKRWWYNRQAKDRVFPRLYPWCFNTGSKYTLPAGVVQFKPSFDATKHWRAFDPDRDSWYAHFLKGTGLITDIKSYRLQIKSKVVKSWEEGKYYFKMEQWAVFELSLKNVKHLYVQSIGGPFGVPVGEFNIDFKCNLDSTNYYFVASVVPCHFAPKSAFSWPNVFVMHSGMGETTIRFRFRWTESQCHETSVMQFIMIATNDFKTNDYVLSPVYQFQQLDNGSAVPSPYHPYHDDVSCDEPAISNNLIEIIDRRLSRIIPNRQYDDCVLNGKAGTKDLTRDQCANGHFACSPKWKTKNQWETQGMKWYTELEKEPIELCCEVDFPLPPAPPKPTTTSTTSASTTTTSTTVAPVETTTESPQRKQQKLQERLLGARSQLIDIGHKITHGDVCIFTFGIVIPMADLLVRYFKDYANISHLGLGFWILSHVILHTAGLVTSWWSYGLVAGGGNERLEKIIVKHYVAGSLAAIFQHAEFLTGWKRAARERKAFNWVLTHSICGYMSHLAAYASVVLSTAALGRKWLSLGLSVIWLVGSTALFYAEKRQERILGLEERAKFPILERIAMEEGSPPMGKTKILIIIASALAQLALFICIMAVHSSEKVTLKKFFTQFATNSTS